MSFEYKLPDVGEGLTEADIVSWRVKEGDVIEINDIVVEIETAKSLVELPSPYAGTVAALLVAEGETVAVGTPIIRIGDGCRRCPEEGRSPVSKPARRSLSPRSTSPTRPPAVAARGRAWSGATRPTAAPPAARAAAPPARPATPERRPRCSSRGRSPPAARSRRTWWSPTSPPYPAAVGTPEPAPAAETRALAKPPVRKLAKDLGVDLAALTGSGPEGSVTRDDVESAASGATSYEVAATATSSYDVTGERERREPIKGVRKMMGQAMVDSAFSAPHVTEWVTVDVTRTMEFVERLRAHRDFREVKVSPLLVLARACMLAMRRTPEINSWWDDAAQEVVFKSYVNLGIAAATPRGLVVPNVKDAERLSLLELAQAFGELTATAREGRTQPAEMSGGTFTITNVGPFGVDGGTPIINPGESAILCFGAVKRQPWVVGTGSEERLEIRDVCTLALSFDHRHVDGEKGSRFLSDVAAVMADPASALLF